MFMLTEPSTQVVREFIATQRDSSFSYAAVGATNAVPPPKYTLDHNRVQLGLGNEVYEHAVQALRLWRHFDLGWVKIVPPGSGIEVGTTVAVQARTFGFWSLSACRIVYFISDEAPMKRFGFAYGTLADHVERGEERFTIEWHREDNSVWYDILAFSRPGHPLVRIAFPLARMLQKRFIKESLAVMAAAARE
jgi:uncharacterized protein (UPF0548 family)